jgi:hypothetical protein
MEIILTRIEGMIDECNKPKSFATFSEANAQLTRWSYTAPQNGGYDKVKFTIKDEAADIDYAGRYDLKHWKLECANLRGHVVGYLEFMAGDYRPSHMTPEQYERFLADYTKEYRAQARAAAAYFKVAP